MVNVDSVYQAVLAIANKEQRGYITPQEFNLFANQAQIEIFEQYFYDKNQFLKIGGNSEEYSDIIDNLNEKIAPFEINGEPLATGVVNTIPVFLLPEMYRLGTVIYFDNNFLTRSVEVEEVQQNELLYILDSPMIAPTHERPIYFRETGGAAIRVYVGQDLEATGGVSCNYVEVPTRASWAYVVVNDKAMYNQVQSVNFDLHPVEETELVYKILKLAGIAMRRDDVMKAGQGMEVLKIQQEKQ